MGPKSDQLRHAQGVVTELCRLGLASDWWSGASVPAQSICRLRLHRVNEKICRQSRFILITIQPFFWASSYSPCVNAPTLVSGSLGRDHRRTHASHHRAARAWRAAVVARLGVFEHLAVAVRVAERGVGTAANHQVNALRFASLVIVQ